MIEAVKPDDEEKLNEIGSRVTCYLNYFAPIDDLVNPNSKWRIKARIDRNALKAIRPEGWGFSIRIMNDGRAWVEGYRHVYGVIDLLTPIAMPNECLAELHAIIQAIEWERNNK